MTRWAQTVVARKWWVLSLAVLIVLISGVWGLGVFGKLSQGGFIDPGSDSAKVADIIEDNLGPQTPDIIAIYSPTDGKTLDDAVAAKPLSDIGARIGATEQQNGDFVRLIYRSLKG